MQRDRALAHTVRKVSFWIGVATAGAIPLVPVAFGLLYPPKQTQIEKSAEGLSFFALDVLGGMADGILAMVWIAGLAAAAVLASLVALSAAWVGGESRRTKLVCLLPLLLLALAVGTLIAIEA